MKKLILLGLLALAAFAFWFYRQFLRTTELPEKPRTVEQVVHALAPQIEPRLQSWFRHAGLAFPPQKITLLALKQERRLDLYAPDESGKMRLIHSWPILAASGGPGLKLREGDSQVPEGFYRIELLNPNSRFHLSLRVNYPNPEDIARAHAENRDTATLGGDIMIHGSAVSIGCIAIGNPAAEELFYLAARTGLDGISLLIVPRDFRQHPAETSSPQTDDLYRRLAAALIQYPPP